MPVVLFAAPFFTENAKRFIHATAALPGVRVGVISQDPIELLSSEIRALIQGHTRVADGLSADDLVRAARDLSAQLGPIHRFLGTIEQIQVPLAEARARLGVPGMSVEVAHNFRDKTRMKEILGAAKIPVARHRLITSEAEAWPFAEEVGLPIVIKPPSGAASQATYRADSRASLGDALRASAPSPDRPTLLEEFVTGDEHSFDAFSLRGGVVFSSVSRYYPTPLEVMENPWMQWVVVLPRELDSPAFDDIRAQGAAALAALGLETGMCHLEWFRKKDGSLVISEVGARPPGAQIATLISRAHGTDCVGAWAQLMVYEELDPLPERIYSTGGAYLRGQGQGVVRAVHGLDIVERDVGHLITDARLPEVGQAKSLSYEGEGFVLVRHPETKVVEEALRHIISNVRVELG